MSADYGLWLLVMVDTAIFIIFAAGFSTAQQARLVGDGQYQRSCSHGSPNVGLPADHLATRRGAGHVGSLGLLEQHVGSCVVDAARAGGEEADV